MLTIATCALSLGTMPSSAELVATPLRGDTRLVQFPFDQDNTYLVLSKPRAVTHLQFAPDEGIQSVAVGDTQNWEINPTKNRKNIFIKPKFEDQETSLTVLTNKRTYQFVLRSTGDGRKWYQRVNFEYSRDLVLEMDQGPSPETDAPIVTTKPMAQVPSQPDVPEGIKPENLRFGYEITGDAEFKPSIAFDDGKFTYIVMPDKLQELPALFSVIDGSQYSLVNYTVKGNRMEVQRLIDTVVLKLGKNEVTIKRMEPKKGLFSWGSN